MSQTTQRTGDFLFPPSADRSPSITASSSFAVSSIPFSPREKSPSPSLLYTQMCVRVCVREAERIEGSISDMDVQRKEEEKDRGWGREGERTRVSLVYWLSSSSVVFPLPLLRWVGCNEKLKEGKKEDAE